MHDRMQWALHAASSSVPLIEQPIYTGSAVFKLRMLYISSPEEVHMDASKCMINHCGYAAAVSGKSLRSRRVTPCK